MASGQGLIERSLRLLMAMGTGEAVDATRQANYLSSLNKMLETWNIQRHFIFSLPRKEFNLVAGKNPHTIGTATVDFTVAVARPPKIENASIEDSGIEYPLQVFNNLDVYQSRPQKTTQTQIPYELHYEPASPKGNIYLYPVPSTANKLILYIWELLTNAITWAGTFDLAPGYEEAIVYNLAIRIAPEEGRSELVGQGTVIWETARELLMAVRNMNIPPLLAKPDPSIPGITGWGYYNILTHRDEQR